MHIRGVRTLSQAFRYYLDTEGKRSIERDARDFDMLKPWVGHLELGAIKRPVLMPFVIGQLRAGKARATVARSLRVLRRVLVLATDEWEWMDRVPLLRVDAMLSTAEREVGICWPEPQHAHWLTLEEQRRFIPLLPEHLQRMALFGIHTGARQEEICGLQWHWLRQGEVWYFDVPASKTKSGRRRPLVLNRAARAIVESLPEERQHVFTRKGTRVQRMNNTGWRTARRKAGVPLRVHDLRHVFACRLRDAGVEEWTIRDLLGHSGGSVTRMYAAPSLRALYVAAEAPYASTAQISNVG